MEFESAFAKRMLKSAAHRFASQPSTAHDGSNQPWLNKVRPDVAALVSHSAMCPARINIDYFVTGETIGNRL